MRSDRVLMCPSCMAVPGMAVMIGYLLPGGSNLLVKLYVCTSCNGSLEGIAAK